MKPEFNVLVTCVGGRLIYDIVTALRAAEDFDVLITGIDADPSAAGRLLCDRFEVSPMAEQDEPGFIDQLLGLHKQKSIDVVLALSDGEARVISKNRDQLIAAGMQVSASSHETVSVMTDKLLMLQRLTEKNIYAGEYRPVDDSDSAERIIAELGYPDRMVVLKPRKGVGSRGVLIADASKNKFERLLENRFCGTGNFRALFEALRSEGGDFSNFIATPYCGGPVYDVDCIALNGELRDCAARLRQLKNPLSPTSTGHRVTMNQQVLDYARELCKAFNVNGAGDFDIAITDEDRPLLFDAGARFSGSVGGSFTAGANFPAQLVRVLTGLDRIEMEIEDGCVLRPYITMARIPSDNQDDLL